MGCLVGGNRGARCPFPLPTIVTWQGRCPTTGLLTSPWGQVQAHGYIWCCPEQVVEGSSEEASPHTMCSAPSDFCREVGALVRRFAKFVLPRTRVCVQPILHRSGWHIALQGTAEVNGEETWCLLKNWEELAPLLGGDMRMHTAVFAIPACAQCCIFSIVRANFQKYDLYSAPIARALPRYIVPFFKFFKTGKCFKTMLFPVSCVSQKPLAFQKHSLLLIQPKTHAKTLSKRSEKCATVQVLTDENSVARTTYLQRALAALWRALYQV